MTVVQSSELLNLLRFYDFGHFNVFCCQLNFKFAKMLKPAIVLMNKHTLMEHTHGKNRTQYCNFT